MGGTVVGMGVRKGKLQRPQPLLHSRERGSPSPGCIRWLGDSNRSGRGVPAARQ